MVLVWAGIKLPKSLPSVVHELLVLKVADPKANLPYDDKASKVVEGKLDNGRGVAPPSFVTWHGTGSSSMAGGLCDRGDIARDERLASELRRSCGRRFGEGLLRRASRGQGGARLRAREAEQWLATRNRP